MATAKKTAKETTVSIPKIRRETLLLRLVGMSPLICHKWSEKAIKQIRDKQQKKATSKKEAKDPVAEFNGARYRMDDGADGFPAAGIKKAMVDAAHTFVEIQKNHTRGGVHVNLGAELVPIQFFDGADWKSYGIEREPEQREDFVRINSKGPGSGTADLRYRPEYTGWSIPIRVEFNATLFSAEQVINLINIAGFSIGLGEDRPQLGRGGNRGMFEVAADEAMREAAE